MTTARAAAGAAALVPHALRSRLLATASDDVRYYFHERFTKREESFVPAVLN